MNRSTLLILCLIGVTILNQGSCKPSESADDYPQDGDFEDDEEEEDSEPLPKMISKNKTLLVDIGESVALPCDLTGNSSKLSRVWTKDETIGLFVGSFRQTNNDRLTNTQNGALEIRQIRSSDEGNYTCLIYENEKVTYTLEIKSAAQITEIHPKEQHITLKEHSSLTLKCVAGVGKPTPEVKWFKNDYALGRVKEDGVLPAATYTIVNASSEDSGFYKCTAFNKLQAVPDSRIIEIQVTYPPEVKIAEGEDIVPTGEGYESDLRCIVTGPKKPQVKWYKDGSPIEPSKLVKIDKKGSSHYLKITSTKEADFGNYKCVAKNTEGESSAIIQLTGRPKPIYKEFTTEKETNDPVLVFNTTSFAPLEEYELLYKRQEENEWVSLRPSPAVSNPEEGTNVYVLKQTISGLEPGVYVAQMKAKNMYGWSQYSAQAEFPKEHEGDLRQTEELLGAESSCAELRISLALLVSLLVARFYC